MKRIASMILLFLLLFCLTMEMLAVELPYGKSHDPKQAMQDLIEKYGDGTKDVEQTENNPQRNYVLVPLWIVCVVLGYIALRIVLLAISAIRKKYKIVKR